MSTTKIFSSVEHYFKACSYLLLFQSFFTLSLTGKVDLFSLILYLLALILSWYSDKPDSKLQINARTANILALTFLPLAYLDFRFISGSFIVPLIHYTLFISIFNLFKVKANRDWVFLYLIAVFEVLLAATLTVDITFIVMLIIFLLLILATLEAFEIKRSSKEVYTPKTERLIDRIGRLLPIKNTAYLVGATLVMVLLISLISIPIFLLIPRFNTSMGGQSFGASTITLSGFSDMVELGQISSIKKNEQVIMHVRANLLNGELNIAPKWRGVTLSYYNGHSWSDPSRNSMKFLKSAEGKYQITKSRSKTAKILEQTIYIEALSSPVIFAANQPLAVNDKLTSLYLSPSDTITTDDHSYQQIGYTAYSDVSRPSDESLNQDEQPYEDEIKKYYLQLPEIDARIANLAKEITAKSTTRLAKAKAIELYLKTKLGYSLELERTKEPDPLVDFLFNTRKGHCEYFASAMVVMLRSQGIAARVVNGFQTGEYNDVSGVFTVRQSDAHSWVEAYFPATEQWIEFDPTPAAGLSHYTTGIWKYLDMYRDAVKVLWLDYVVTYDSQRQTYLASVIQQAASGYKAKTEGFISRLRQYATNLTSQLSTGQILSTQAPLLVLITGLLIISTLLWQFRKLVNNWQLAPNRLFLSNLGRLLVLPWLRWRNRANSQQSVILFYNEMLAILARKGIARKPYQTPIEFAAELDLAPVKSITEYYNSIRFSGSDLSGADQQQLQESLKSLKKYKPTFTNTDKPIVYRRLFVPTTVFLLVTAILFSVYGLYYYTVEIEDLAFRSLEETYKHPYQQPHYQPSNCAKLLAEVRTEKGISGQALDAILTSSTTPMQLSPTGLAAKSPWEQDFKSVESCPKEQINQALQHSDFKVLTEIAQKDQFVSANIIELGTGKYSRRGPTPTFIRLNDRVELLLWQAALEFQANNREECQKTLAILLSLGLHLVEDKSLADVQKGYFILTKVAIALSKYYELIDNPLLAKEWGQFAREGDTFRRQLYPLKFSLINSALSDSSLEQLYVLILTNSEEAFTKEVIAVIGEGWLANPHQALWGMSDKRRNYLEALTRSKRPGIAAQAETVLKEADKLSLSARLKALGNYMLPMIKITG